MLRRYRPAAGGNPMPEWQIYFTSDTFEPFLPEECQVNPGAYGFELATWLAKSLAEAGVVTSYPVSEDWGWFIEYTDDETETLICCGNVFDDEETEAQEWTIFLQPVRSLRQRLARTDSSEPVQYLSDAICDVLTAAGIAYEH